MFALKPYGNAFYSGQSGTFSVIDYEPVLALPSPPRGRGWERIEGWKLPYKTVMLVRKMTIITIWIQVAQPCSGSSVT